MATQTTVEQVFAQGDAAFSELERWRNRWQEAMKYLAPERSLVTDFLNTPRHIYDSAPVVATRNLRNLLISGMMPPWSRWFRLVPGAGVKEKERQDVARELYKISDQLMTILLGSNFYAEMNASWIDIAVPGHAVMTVEPSDDGFGVRFTNVPVERAALQRGRYGRRECVYRKVKYTGYDIMANEKWRAAVEKKAELTKSIKENPAQVVECFIAALPENEMSRMYRKVVALRGYGDLVLEDVTMSRNPYMVAPWENLPEVPYSNGVGMMVMDDARGVNRYQQHVGQLVGLAAGGAWTIHSDLPINTKQFGILPGLMIPVASNDEKNPPIRRLDLPGNPDVARFGIQDKRADISQMTYGDYAGPLGLTPKSAEEIQVRNTKIEQSLGAPMSLITHEFTVPLLQQVIDILGSTRRGLRGLRIDRNEIDVIFLSPVAQAVRMADARSMREAALAAAEVSQYDGRVLGEFNFPAYIRLYNELLGTNPAIIRTAEEAKRYNDEAAQGAMMTAQGMNAAA